MQVEIVSLGILGASAGCDGPTRHAQGRQQTLAHLRGHVGLQSDQVLRRGGKAGLPQQAVVAHVNRFQRDQQIVALLQEVSGQHGGNVQLPSNFLRIGVVGGVLLRQ